MKQLSLFPTSSREKATKIWDEVVRIRIRRNGYEESPQHRKGMIEAFTSYFESGGEVVIINGYWSYK